MQHIPVKFGLPDWVTRSLIIRASSSLLYPFSSTGFNRIFKKVSGKYSRSVFTSPPPTYIKKIKMWNFCKNSLHACVGLFRNNEFHKDGTFCSIPYQWVKGNYDNHLRKSWYASIPNEYIPVSPISGLHGLPIWKWSWFRYKYKRKNVYHTSNRVKNRHVSFPAPISYPSEYSLLQINCQIEHATPIDIPTDVSIASFQLFNLVFAAFLKAGL